MERHEDGISAAVATIESLNRTKSSSTTTTTTISKRLKKKRINYSNICKTNFKQFLIATITVAVIIIHLNPFSDQTNCVQGLGLKEKKVLKTVAKGLLIRNLSTKKSFLPLPVPIPGKWQQILTTLFDNLNSDSSVHRKYSSVAAAYAAADTSSKRKQTNLLLKLLSPKALSNIFQHLPTAVSPNKLSPSKTSTNNKLDNVKKYTRYAAAKYASKLISNQGSSSSIKLSPTASAAVSFLGKPPKRADDSKFSKNLFAQSMSHRKLFKGYLRSPSSSSTAAKKIATSNNDPIVTLFNLVKLFQQLKELDSSKLINLSKKSSAPSKSSLPILSMNINNKKTFLNKMHYIHTLTTDFNHRHRHLQNGLSLF